MKWRYQLPAYSPISVGGLGRGLRGLTGDRSSLQAVERWIAASLKARQVLLTDSGTTALSLALSAVGSPVALPAYGCFDLATAADGAGATVLLYDIQPATLSPEPDSLNRALEAGATAVVGVHFYGIPSTLTATPPAVPLIEDAAQALGGSLGAASLGSTGSLAVLSFGRGKGVTGGGGGALVANDPQGVELLDRVSSNLRPGGAGLGSWARSVGQWLLSRPSLYQVPASMPFLGLGETEYHPPHPPAGMSSGCAGIIVDASEMLEREVERRRAHARRLHESARRVKGLQAIEELEGASPSYLRLPLIASEPIRAAAILPEARRLGIMPGYPTPLGRLPGFAPRILNPGQPSPGADLLARRLITLPVHGRMRERDLAALEQWMRALA